MDQFKFKVVLSVEVEAYDESDAWDTLQDNFGIGDNMGVKVTDCEYKEIRGRKK